MNQILSSLRNPLTVLLFMCSLALSYPLLIVFFPCRYHLLFSLLLLSLKKSESYWCHYLSPVTFIRKNGVPMCSIQLLSNTISNIAARMKSVKLGLLMWLHEKKEHGLSGTRKNKPWKIQQNLDIMNAANDEHFRLRVFSLSHDTSLTGKFNI